MMSKLEGEKEHQQTINAIDQEKIRKKATAQIERENRKSTYNSVYKVLNFSYDIICWVLTCFTLFVAVGTILIGKILSPICFILTIILINPATSKLIKNKGFNYSKKGALIIYVVGFLIGMLAVSLP